MTGRARFHISGRVFSIALIAFALALSGCLGAHHRCGSKCKRAQHKQSYRAHHGACYFNDAAYSVGALACVEKRLLECGEKGQWVVLEGESCG